MFESCVTLIHNLRFKIKTMKKVFLALALLLVGSTLTFAQHTMDKKSEVELTESKVMWTGDKPGGSHNGTIGISDYTINKDGENLSGTFTFDLATIECLDLEGSWKEKLEGHLKSADFFDVATYPTATFNLTETVKAGDNYLLIGELTIKETTKSVAFPAEIDFDKKTFSLSSEFTIDRTDYGIEYGNESMAAKLKDKIIYDDIDLKLDFSAKY